MSTLIGSVCSLQKVVAHYVAFINSRPVYLIQDLNLYVLFASISCPVLIHHWAWISFKLWNTSFFLFRLPHYFSSAILVSALSETWGFFSEDRESPSVPSLGRDAKLWPCMIFYYVTCTPPSQNSPFHINLNCRWGDCQVLEFVLWWKCFAGSSCKKQELKIIINCPSSNPNFIILWCSWVHWI